MRLEHESVPELKKKIRAIVGRHLDLSQYQLFFFGSRVAGNGDERSDIDIGIRGASPAPAEAKLEIEDELEQLPVLYKIDFVDFGAVADDFRQVALAYVEPIV